MSPRDEYDHSIVHCCGMHSPCPHMSLSSHVLAVLYAPVVCAPAVSAGPACPLPHRSMARSSSPLVFPRRCCPPGPVTRRSCSRAPSSPSSTCTRTSTPPLARPAPSRYWRRIPLFDSPAMKQGPLPRPCRVCSLARLAVLAVLGETLDSQTPKSELAELPASRWLFWKQEAHAHMCLIHHHYALCVP